MEQQQQQKRGRKKRGGFNNLQDIIKSQPPEKHFNQITENSTFKLFPDDLPWQQQTTNVSTTTPVTTNVKISKTKSSTKEEIYQDEEDLDNIDLFPNDDVIEYETIYKTQSSSNGNRTLHMNNVQDINDIYRPQQQGTSNVEQRNNHVLDIGLIPEHLRIIDVSSFLKNDDSVTVPTTPTNTKEPELYHPLRVNFYDDSEYKLVKNYKIDDDISWPSRSPFACWWCCHTFDDYPKPIAIKIDGKNIKVMGNCCSWECNKAYSIKNLKTLSLFHTFYYRLFKESSDHIKIAPSPLCTKMFGGSMSIEEYRGSFHNIKRRVSMDVLSNINITVAKTFIYDSKYVENKLFEKSNKKRKITTDS